VNLQTQRPDSHPTSQKRPEVQIHSQTKLKIVSYSGTTLKYGETAYA
jgi:hypothetical protein